MKTRSQTAHTAGAHPKPLKTVQLAPKPRPKPRRKGPLGDPRRPKKPPTAFFFFLEDYRKIFQQENPNVKSMREVGKACGEKWNTMTFEKTLQNKLLNLLRKKQKKLPFFPYPHAADSTSLHKEKVKYYDIATEKRAEFEKSMAEYTKKKESGELSESDYD